VLSALVTACAPRLAPRPPDYRIVVLGDSYASGQGAPDRPAAWSKGRLRPGWDDRRCNRSLNAGARQAVDALRRDDPRFREKRIDVVSVACSGASIEKGVLGPYRGSEPPCDPRSWLEPQVNQAAKVTKPIDALVLTIGGNDILFEYVVAACMLGPRCDFLDQVIVDRLKALHCRLETMADAIGRIGVPPDRILVLECPDPTRADATTFCGGELDGDLLDHIRPCEAEWASRGVLPKLNHEVCESAAAHRWRYVDGIASDFVGHGWCARDRWINTIGDSLCRQLHYRGGMHPNVAGYRAIGARLARNLGDALLQQPVGPAVCPPLEDDPYCAHPCGVPMESPLR
jgi:lysophospholipase L1-like esterase